MVIHNNFSLPNSTQINEEETGISTVKAFEAVVLFSLTALALVGNGLLIYVIYSNSNLRNLRNVFVASLAASDFLFACTDMIYQAMLKVVINFRPPHASICYVVLLSGVFFGAASVFNLTAMTLVRYFSIRYPLHFRNYLTVPRSTGIVFALWIAAFFLAFPPLIWRPEGVVCSTTKPSGEHFVNEAIYMGAEWLFWFFIPALLILCSYYRIYIIARTQARQIAALQVSSPDTNNNDLQPRASSFKGKKAGKMVAILIGFWVICWLPFFTVLTISKFKSKVPAILMRSFLCLMFANAAINPLVLTWYNRELKEAIKRLWCGRNFRRTPSVIIQTRSSLRRGSSSQTTTF